jgi:hypothetical protein
MQQRQKFKFGNRVIRSFVLWTWVFVFATVSIAETTHHHARTGRSEQHCSICIAAHSMARPVHTSNIIAAPTRCVGFLSAAAPLVSEHDLLLDLYIRPPPVL